MKAVQSSLLLMVLGGALFCTYSLPAAAGLSHAGYTGLISTPTPAVEPDGRVSFLFSWIGGNRTYLFSPKINRVYAMTMGLLPGLEVTFRQTQVIGWHDPDAPGIQHSFDRMGSAKYQLPLPGGWPRVAIGIQDFASAGALVGMGGRLDQRGLTTTYAVAGDRLGPLAWSVGYGMSREFINGGFGGVSMDLPGGVMIVTEHDSQSFNLGVRYSPRPWLSLQASQIGDGTQAYSGRIGLLL